MIEPAAFDPETTPAVTLGGKLWPIPELVWRDLRKCRKELLELNSRLNLALGALEGEAGEPDGARAMRYMAVLGDLFDGLSNEDFERLVMGPLHAALCAAHPQLTRDEFDGWRITEAERLAAWLVVRRQSGLFVFGGEQAPSGEGPGAA